MDWMDQAKADVNAVVLWFAASIAAAAIWTVRTVLTSQAKVKAIEASIGEIQSNVRLLTNAMIARQHHEAADHHADD